jgi:hypothetical protein
MKGQVSVDKMKTKTVGIHSVTLGLLYNEIDRLRAENNRLKRLDELISCGITLDEIDRLKRLDRNIKIEIEKIEKVKKLYDDQEFDPSCPLARIVDSKLTFLKSLCNDQK